MVKSLEPISPLGFLEAFAAAARVSRSFDGDWQGDGWGISYRIDDSDKNIWKPYRSLEPVWEDDKVFAGFSETQFFCAHARSASFPQHQGRLEYNQPFIDGRYAYVFNGLIRGVRLPFAVPGDIGAQKIWSLLKGFLAEDPPRISLERLKSLLLDSCREIQALNVGLCDGTHIYALNHYARLPEYYRLHRHTSPSKRIISSEPLAGYSWEPLPADSVISL
jgi:predicted glutamine amidotransferase